MFSFEDSQGGSHQEAYSQERGSRAEGQGQGQEQNEGSEERRAEGARGMSPLARFRLCQPPCSRVRTRTCFACRTSSVVSSRISMRTSHRNTTTSCKCLGVRPNLWARTTEAKKCKGRSRSQLKAARNRAARCPGPTLPRSSPERFRCARWMADNFVLRSEAGNGVYAGSFWMSVFVAVASWRDFEWNGPVRSVLCSYLYLGSRPRPTLSLDRHQK